HAEDSNCAGCILGDAERCRRCRPASQGAAASGASSGWQVAGRQGSDWQISTSSARRDQGLTVCVLDARRNFDAAIRDNWNHSFKMIGVVMCSDHEIDAFVGRIKISHGLIEWPEHVILLISASWIDACIGEHANNLTISVSKLHQ